MEIFYIFLCLFSGQLLKHISNNTGIPYTPMITMGGFLVGMTETGGNAVTKSLTEVDPHVILLIFMPALIFESAFNSDWYVFKKQIGKILLMAGPIMLCCVALTSFVMYYVLNYRTEMSFMSCILFGSIVSATDPVAVVALLKELGASKRLSTLIEGESLLNDGTAMVVFLVVLEVVEGQKELEWLGVIGKFVRLAGGGALLGILAGIILTYWLHRIHNQPVLEANATVVTAYMLFFICEYHTVHVSGIIAIVTLGLFMSHNGKSRISTESEEAIHAVWSYIGFCAETAIFVLAGLWLAQIVLASFTWYDLGKSFALYFCLTLTRYLALMAFFPCMRRSGYKIDAKSIVLLAYSGLRGAVCLCLALLV